LASLIHCGERRGERVGKKRDVSEELEGKGWGGWEAEAALHVCRGLRSEPTPQGRPLPPTSSSTLLPPSLPSSSSAPHHPSPGPSPPIRECQVPLLEKNSTHSHLEPHRDDSYLLRAQSSSTGAANHHSQSTLQPPLPPPHNHHNLSHQSANSLNRNNLRGGRNPIHAPAPGTGDGPTTPESVQLQDSWVLNSNVPLET
ncbi:hypothetical protein CHARACLAT_006136, partial [Characodon lateralis]|nr:hypothetical protein [Characodon lateralis]